MNTRRQPNLARIQISQDEFFDNGVLASKFSREAVIRIATVRNKAMEDIGTQHEGALKAIWERYCVTPYTENGMSRAESLVWSGRNFHALLAEIK